jgi:hypothetical protein
VVAKTYNPSYLGDRDQEDQSTRPVRAKISQHPVTTNGWAQWLTPVIPATQGSTYRKIVVQDSLGIKQNPVPKVTNAKQTGRVAQMVECLPSKCKVLSSVPGARGRNSKYKNQ